VFFIAQAERVCREQGAADVKVIFADLTDPKEAQRLGEVSHRRFVHGMMS
jgi:hypothetical protein